jgi:hypothetical protein
MHVRYNGLKRARGPGTDIAGNSGNVSIDGRSYMRGLLRVTATTFLAIAGASSAAAQTSITSASPSRVFVTPGGDAVTFTIDGTSLEAITGARVTLNGRAVSTVEAVPVKPRFLTRTLTRISITVTASATAAGGTYQVEAMAGRLAIRVPASITVGSSRTITTTRTLALPPPPVPSVTGASPSTLQLQAGGTPQTVIVQGSNLDRVTGARVERSGSPANGMLVQLQASTGSTQRNVTVSAATNAGPPWGVPLDLVLLASPEGTEIEVATNVTMTVPEPPVDLIISSCEFDLDARLARAMISNTGSQPAAFWSDSPWRRRRV